MSPVILQKLEDQRRSPIVIFEKPKNLKGEVNSLQLVTNIFASRKYIAVAFGFSPEKWRMELPLEFSRREKNLIDPIVIDRKESPVKEVTKKGEEADLRELPIPKINYMDPGPYIVMTPVMKDLDTGSYNVAFLRNMYKEPRKLGLWMSPRHNWEITRKHEEQNKPTPVAIVIGHHPLFYAGSATEVGLDIDEYKVISGILNEPLRLVPSETWGKEFLVPADAEIVIEGEVPPNIREIEAPFGEFTRYYGPQRLSWIINVTAITHRKDAIFQSIYVSHRDGGGVTLYAQEGGVYGAIKSRVPTVKAVHCVNPFVWFVSIDKKVEGESKQAALITLGRMFEAKFVIVVDAETDIFDEKEVLWDLATKVGSKEQIDIISEVKGNTLDPAHAHFIKTDKFIIDATKPLDRLFLWRVTMPKEELNRLDLENYLSREETEKIPEE